MNTWAAFGRFCLAVEPETMMRGLAVPLEAIDAALKGGRPPPPGEARALLVRVDELRGAESLAAALDGGDLVARQLAFDALSAVKKEAAERLLARWLDRLGRGELRPGSFHNGYKPA